MPKGPAQGIAIGINAGHITTKIGKKLNKKGKEVVRPSRRRGGLGKRVKLIRETIKEVVGFAPYEKRVMELIKTGIAKDSKKALRLCKARLGTHLRGKNKREELETVIRNQRKK